MTHWGFHHHRQNQIEPAGEGPVESGVYGLIKRLTNNEGAAVDYGDVIKIDISGNELIELTETAGDLLVAGVVASNGPFANGALVPVLIYGYHPSVKVTGAVAAGDVLAASATDGTAETQSPPDEGAFARALTASAGGRVSALVNEPALGAGGAATFLDLTDTPASFAGFSERLVRVNTAETGLEFVATAAGQNDYDPRVQPGSPSAYDDEFSDLTLAAAWTQVNNGSATRTVDETLRKGFVQISNTDGGAGSDTGIYKAFTPGAAAFTVVARLFGDVRNAGSNQNNLYLYDGSGNFIYGVGLLNGSQIIVADSGGFRTYTIGYTPDNYGEIWLMVQRDAGTAYQAFVSKDGLQWMRLEGASRSGTIGRFRLLIASFGSSNANAWVDFVRTFPSQTFNVGGISVGGGAYSLPDHTHASSGQGGAILFSKDVLTAQGDILTRDGTTIKRLARSVPAANVLNVLGLANGDVEPAWKTVLDATAPTTIAAGDAAAAGTSLVFAHRDHRHGAPATYPATMANPSASIGLTAVNGSSTSALRADGAPALSTAIAPTWSGRHVFSGSATITTGVDAYINLTPTVTNNTGNAIAQFGIQGLLNGNGESPIALLVRPFLIPSASINEAFGGSLAAFLNPPAGVTIAAGVGFRGILATSAGAGAITRVSAIRADAFVNIGGPTPTHSIGVEIMAPGGGTNNYSMAVGEVDTTPEGIYYGRFSILYNGLKKYVSVRNA